MVCGSRRFGMLCFWRNCSWYSEVRYQCSGLHPDELLYSLSAYFMCSWPRFLVHCWSVWVQRRRHNFDKLCCRHESFDLQYRSHQYWEETSELYRSGNFSSKCPTEQLYWPLCPNCKKYHWCTGWSVNGKPVNFSTPNHEPLCSSHAKNIST